MYVTVPQVMLKRGAKNTGTYIQLSISSYSSNIYRIIDIRSYFVLFYS